MKYYYNPVDTACKSRVGALRRSDCVTLRVYKFGEHSEQEHVAPEICNLIIGRDGREMHYYPMKATENGWSITLRFNRCGLFFYRFQIGGKYLHRGALQKGEITEINPINWQLTVFDETYHTPEWFKGGVMYQIFPDRYEKEGESPLKEGRVARKWGETPYYLPDENGKVLNNDFFGGNLNGVRKKLDYLKSLGVTVIYFNPVFESYSNHHYDTSDYMKIDETFGTEEQFDCLVKEAEQKGIRVILDGVFNHTGSDSRYFNKNGTYNELGAYQSPDSHYYDWYSFRNFPDEYDSWWGIDTLPAIRESSPSYQEFIFGENGVLKHWLRHHISGYRLDVADELPDFFLKKLRKAVKDENPDALIIGEVWEDASNKIAYGVRRQYFLGSELDSVMNYPLKDAIVDFVKTGNSYNLRQMIATLTDHYPKMVLDSLMNILGTHDTARILTVLGGKECATKDEMTITNLSESEKKAAIDKLKMAAVLQFFLPGVPCIYYGDEIGMEGYRDPFCRACMDWDHVNEQLLRFYKRLSKIRTKLLPQIFRDGTYREVYADMGFLLFERKNQNNEAAYVFVNLSDETYFITLHGKYREYLSGHCFENKFQVKPNSCGVIAKADFFE